MWRDVPGSSIWNGPPGRNEGVLASCANRREKSLMDFEREVEDIRSTLRILDRKVGEITRSIRAYVDFQMEKRMDEAFDEFQERLGRRLSGLESRIETLEKRRPRKRET